MGACLLQEANSAYQFNPENAQADSASLSRTLILAASADVIAAMPGVGSFGNLINTVIGQLWPDGSDSVADKIFSQVQAALVTLAANLVADIDVLTCLTPCGWQLAHSLCLQIHASCMHSGCSVLPESI